MQEICFRIKPKIESHLPLRHYKPSSNQGLVEICNLYAQCAKHTKVQRFQFELHTPTIPIGYVIIMTNKRDACVMMLCRVRSHKYLSVVPKQLILGDILQYSITFLEMQYAFVPCPCRYLHCIVTIDQMNISNFSSSFSTTVLVYCSSGFGKPNLHPY